MPTLRTSSPSLRLAALPLALTVLVAPSLARADLPPPTGTRFVDYSFTVEGVAKQGDYVVFAYPTSMSNGRPTAELSVVTEGMPIPLGRRSGVPKLYSIKRGDFDAWKASYKPSLEDPFKDPAVEALISSGKVVACDAGPSPDFTLPDSDPRSEIREALVAQKIDDKTCDLEVKKAGATPASAGSASPDGSAPPAPSAGDPPASSPKGGCASCSIGGDGSAWIGLAGIGVAALAIARRRR